MRYLALILLFCTGCAVQPYESAQEISEDCANNGACVSGLSPLLMSVEEEGQEFYVDDGGIHLGDRDVLYSINASSNYHGSLAVGWITGSDEGVWSLSDRVQVMRDTSWSYSPMFTVYD